MSLEISAINFYKYSLFTANAGNGSVGREGGARDTLGAAPACPQCPLCPHSMDPSPWCSSCLSPRLGEKPTTSFHEIPRISIPRISIPRTLLVHLTVQPSSHGLSRMGNPWERFHLPWEMGNGGKGSGPVPKLAINPSGKSGCSSPVAPPGIPVRERGIPNRERGIPAREIPTQPRESPIPAPPSTVPPHGSSEHSRVLHCRLPGKGRTVLTGKKLIRDFSGTTWQKIPFHSTNPRSSRGMFIF